MKQILRVGADRRVRPHSCFSKVLTHRVKNLCVGEGCHALPRSGMSVWLLESVTTGGHSGPPLRGGFVSEKVTWDPKPILVFDPARPARTSVATRRRVECGADVPGAGHFSYRGLEVTDHSASGRAGTVVDGHNQQIVTQYPRRDHRRWSPHMEASRNEQAQPNPSHNGIRVSSGEIGTHAIHPPGKRSIDINKSHFHTETRIRTQRPHIGRFCDPSFHPQQQHPLQR